jgi:hypothetical protein
VVDESDTPLESRRTLPRNDDKRFVKSVFKGFNIAKTWTADIVSAVTDTVSDTIATGSLFDSVEKEKEKEKETKADEKRPGGTSASAGTCRRELGKQDEAVNPEGAGALAASSTTSS